MTCKCNCPETKEKGRINITHEFLNACLIHGGGSLNVRDWIEDSKCPCNFDYAIVKDSQRKTFCFTLLENPHHQKQDK